MTPKIAARHALSALLYESGITRLAANWDASYRIVMYHRVIDPESVSFPLQSGMYVRPETFRRHLQYLSRSCSVLTLDELVRFIADGRRPPRRAVVITFDDGWRDNYDYALPLLKEFRLPATIFLATGYVGNQRLFWTDAAGLMISRLHSNQPSVEFVPGEDRLDRNTFLRLKDLFRVLRTVPPSQAIDQLIAFLSHLSRERRHEFLSAIEETLVENSTPMPNSFFSWEQVRELSSSLITFGSHSHTHEMLTELEEQELEDEINASYDAFKTNGVTPLLVFCYPNGAYSDRTQRVLEEKGIRFALGDEKLPRTDSSPLLLGRIGAHDDITSNAALFASRLWLEKIF